MSHARCACPKEGRWFALLTWERNSRLNSTRLNSTTLHSTSLHSTSLNSTTLYSTTLLDASGPNASKLNDFGAPPDLGVAHRRRAAVGSRSSTLRPPHATTATNSSGDLTHSTCSLAAAWTRL